MRRKIGTELKAGIFVLVGLVVICTMILFIGGSSLLEKNFTAYVVVPDALGVVKGAVIKSGGLKIGRVSDISFSEDYASVKIALLVEERFRQRIRSDSVVRFQTQGMLGDKYLEIIGGTTDSAVVADGSTLDAEATKDLSTVLSDSQGVIQLLKDNLVNLKQISGSFVQNRQSEKFFKDMGEVATNLREITGQIKSSNSMRDLNSTIHNFKIVSEKMKNGEGTIGALFNDPSLYEDMKNLIGGANRSKVLKFFVRQAVKSSDETKEAEADKEKKK